MQPEGGMQEERSGSNESINREASTVRIGKRGFIDTLLLILLRPALMFEILGGQRHLALVGLVQ